MSNNKCVDKAADGSISFISKNNTDKSKNDSQINSESPTNNCEACSRLCECHPSSTKLMNGSSSKDQDNNRKGFYINGSTFKLVMIVSLLVGICAVFLLHSTAAKPSQQDQLLVQTSHGMVRGEEKESRGGRTYLSFRGMPYAKPPLGVLRFKAPQQPEPWQGIFEATKNGNECLQKNYLFSQTPKVEGSEDCLYINVYAPKQNVYNPKLPILIFFHYGGNFVGSGSSGILGPEYLMDKNIILVTLNYRLNVFGFYSTLDDNAPGNNGYKDQVAAMRWVQANIEAFGGDKNQVTIGGQSAGGAGVHHHLLSPLSKGLFHQAISMSGTALNLWAKPFNVVQEQLFRSQAEVVGCDPKADTKTIVECLQKVDAVALINSQDIFKSPPQRIIGTVVNEGILRSAALIRQEETLRQLNERFDVLGPQIMLMSLSTPENLILETWRKMTQFYIGTTEGIDRTNATQIQGFTNLYTDRSFFHGIYQSALLHSFKGHKPIWLYNFGYRGELSYGDLFASTNETVDFKWGASHCDDLLYLFASPDLFPPLPESDVYMSRIMVKLFTNFVKFGDPTPNIYDRANHQGWDAMPDLEGQPMLNKNFEFLNITGPHDTIVSIPGSNNIALKMEAGIYPKRMAFLGSLPLYENMPGMQ